MTDIDHMPLLPEPPLREPRPDNGPNGFSRWRRSLAMGGMLAFGLALGAVSFAVAAGAMDQFGWRQSMHLALVQRGVSHALDSVGATAAQEAAIHDIIAAKFSEIAPDPKQHEALRKQALDLLSAPTIDRAAVEKLRADMIAGFDAKSKLLVSGVLDIADQLMPAQRAALVARVEEMAQHGGPLGPWGGLHGARPMTDEPEGAPDGRPGEN